MSKQSSLHPKDTDRLRGKSKRPKIVSLWFRPPRGSLFNTWWRFGRYHSEADAKMVIKAKSTDLYYGRGAWHIGDKRPEQNETET